MNRRIEFLSCVPVFLLPRPSSEEGRRTLRAFVAIVGCNAFVNAFPLYVSILRATLI